MLATEGGRRRKDTTDAGSEAVRRIIKIIFRQQVREQQAIVGHEIQNKVPEIRLLLLFVLMMKEREATIQTE